MRYRRWHDIWSYDVYTLPPGNEASGALHAPEPVEPAAESEHAEAAVAVGETHARARAGDAGERPPKPKLRRVRPEPVPDEPVPLPIDDKQRFLEQVGPSCWLFVIEAMANTAGFNTRPLGAALYLYPTNVRDDRKRHQLMEEITRRLEAVKNAFAPERPAYRSQHAERIAAAACPSVRGAALKTFTIRLLAGLPHDSLKGSRPSRA